MKARCNHRTREPGTRNVDDEVRARAPDSRVRTIPSARFLSMTLPYARYISRNSRRLAYRRRRRVSLESLSQLTHNLGMLTSLSIVSVG